jgi:hypothetical protein
MANDRRSDMGQKIMIGLILGGFGTIMGFFINSLVDMANDGIEKAQSAVERTMKLEAKFYGFESASVEYMKRMDERFMVIQSQLIRLDKRKEV